MTSKAALPCFISTGFVAAFKLLYKDSIDTVNRPSFYPVTLLFLVIMARVRTASSVSL